MQWANGHVGVGWPQGIVGNPEMEGLVQLGVYQETSWDLSG